LIVMGLPGEVHAGALAERLRRMWQIIFDGVGDDPAADLRGVYQQSWEDLRERYSAEGDLVIEGDRWSAIYLQDATRMVAVVEACIAADEL
jgi:hypothetical protein